jgi:hypothetical protein
MELGPPLSLFCFASGDNCKKHMLIYIYIYIFYLNGVENLCHYTLSPRSPNHHEFGSWGLGWTDGASLLGGIPQKSS